jgi:hypothetical protein
LIRKDKSFYLEYAKFRPRLRLLEDVENDLRELKIKRWGQKARNNREAWTSAVEEDNVLRGEWGQGMSKFIFSKDILMCSCNIVSGTQYTLV